MVEDELRDLRNYTVFNIIQTTEWTPELDSSGNSKDPEKQKHLLRSGAFPITVLPERGMEERN